MNFLRLFLSLALYLRCTGSSRILAFPEFPSHSHHVIFNPIWRELSLRGHQVTVITPNPMNDPTLSNLTEIDVGSAYEVVRKKDFVKNMAKGRFIVKRLLFLHKMLSDCMEEEMQHEEFQQLLRLPSDHFDLLIVQTMHPLVYAIGAKFKAPIVGVSSMGVFPNSHDVIGNPTHPVLSPDFLVSPEGDMTFFDKIDSLFFNIVYRLVYHWIILPESDATARKYFGKDIPYLGDIESNTSLLLMNINPFVHPIRANVPAAIEVNQLHITEPKPLPKDIKDFLDSSPQGVVYFSLGSNVKSANLSSRTREVIVRALGEVPYKVLWKWETDTLPNKPDNVMTRKWLPQQDILGHPNVKVFVTQGGLQSVEEAISYAVPMVGLPFITDQPGNIKKITDLGMGLGLDYRTMSKEQLKNAIMEVGENSWYKQKISDARLILVDQPIRGVPKAVWWIEYIIRHKGARHMRSPAADMSYFEYFMMDVFLFLFVCFFVIVYTVIKMLRILRTLFRSQKVKVN
ncbi:unnamed protein product [Phaedon cochleariae]|uniref:UDP-glucuronosyltransferase n=1 Tax=Phaedon cochleariae TaxID=80249 RepID=A0A9P0DQM9_PHACE|nr:unnamed protein product [Phaedon cochleariae]